tara:strand:- start:160 stop:294 length:135 start_codon:yes stop_codon:yes gene_type:complete
MSRDRLKFICKKCDSTCKLDEINEDMVCIDCTDLICELGDNEDV